MTDNPPRRPPPGAYVAPEGYYEATKAMPFLGAARCEISEIAAGDWLELVLDYEVGASGLADGAWIKATFKFYSDWALFQTTDPAGENYVSAEYRAGPLLPGQEAATVKSLLCRFDQKGHERPFQKAIIIDIVDGYLNPGDHIVIRLGDRRFGGAGTRAQTFVEKDFKFRFYVDPVGTSRFAAVPGDIVLQIVPNDPHHLIVTAPARPAPAPRCRCAFAGGRRRGNTCWNHGARIELAARWASLSSIRGSRSIRCGLGDPARRRYSDRGARRTRNWRARRRRWRRRAGQDLRRH